MRARAFTPIGVGEPEYLALAAGGAAGAEVLYLIAINRHNDTAEHERDCLGLRANSPAEAVRSRLVARGLWGMHPLEEPAFMSSDGLTVRQ